MPRRLTRGALLPTGRRSLDYEAQPQRRRAGLHVLRITWTSAEDHLQGFRGGDRFPEFLAAIRSYVGDIEEMRHYERDRRRGRRRRGADAVRVGRRHGGARAADAGCSTSACSPTT